MNAKDHQALEPASNTAGSDSELAVDSRVKRALPDDHHRVATLSSLTTLVDAYLNEKDQQRVREAFRFGDNAHLGQVRSSGSPYISHPIAVAEICAGWKLDADSIMAAILHDTVEDTDVTKDNILEQFGANVADLVDGLSKLDRIRFATREHQQAESFRKMLLAMATDARVILIKLADRLHNMRTIDALKPEKRRRVATETLEVYAPIASRLGLYKVYRELLDRSFKAAYPRRFDVLSRAVQTARGNRRDSINEVFQRVSDALPAAGIKAEVFAREKAIYSIYQKMRNKRLPFSKVYDVYGVRIVVDELLDCYRALGALHMTYKPIPGRFKDYIALGKDNGYQSLHTSLLGPSNIPIEFQIRTHEMQRIAESGVAAHWLYKTDAEEFSDLSRLAHNWLQTLLDIQSTTGDGIEFMDHVKVDLFPDEVYVFTPVGDIRALPRNATVLDYAYSVHTDIGNKAVGGRINGSTAHLNDELTSGDVVEVITDDHATPRPVWLNWVRSGRARSEIRHFLKTMRYDESVELGRRLMETSLSALNINPATTSIDVLEKTARDSGASSLEELYADIGIGKRLATLEARAVALSISGKHLAASAMPRLTPLFVTGDERSAITYSTCCHPIPDDKIVGHLRGGHGLVLHRSGCKTANRLRDRDPEHFIDVRWASDKKSDFRAYVDMESTPGPGTLGIVAAEISAAGANIVDVIIDEDEVSGKLRIGVHIRDRTHLAQLMRSLRNLDVIRSVRRG
ncbi:MAG: bifunctional (p)ppGpp synthetase/guanosine-3',5'-bis(diphosphate) 3'-pyrophosphohydrolase [Burkholderiaceae bacterium]